MKKILALVLLAALVLVLAACGGNNQEGAGAEYAGTFRAGFAQQLINPKESVPLAGYGRTSSRMSQNITEDLYAQCVALTDEEENTILIFALDAINCRPQYAQAAEKLSAEYGIPVENIIINTSHSHSSPDASSSLDSSKRYLEFVIEQIYETGKLAMNNRKPAKMYYGTAETEGLNFIRHYLMDDGSYGGDSFGDWDNHYAQSHTADADTTMYVLKFECEGEKDIALVNWRAHAAMTGSAGKGVNVSSDFLGPFRDSLNVLANCRSIYLNGHSGNINPNSRMEEELDYVDYKEHGYKLAQFAYQALQNTQQLETGTLKASRTVLDGNINHTMDHMAVKAAELSAIWNTTGNRELVIEEGLPYGIRSPYQANAISRNAKLPATQEIQVNVLSIGKSVAITTGPAELFDRNSMAIEEASPFQVTLCLGYTNDSVGYIPADYVWEYTSYETDTTRFERGTAERIEESMKKMIGELYGN